MSAPDIGNFPVPPRLAVFGVTLAAVGILATTASTRDTPQSVGFACDSGDRFDVEIHQGYVRLRDGTGIFSLRHEPSMSTTSDARGTTYTDGKLVLKLRPDSGSTSLERIGMPTGHNCAPDGERT